MINQLDLLGSALSPKLAFNTVTGLTRNAEFVLTVKRPGAPRETSITFTLEADSLISTPEGLTERIDKNFIDRAVAQIADQTLRTQLDYSIPDTEFKLQIIDNDNTIEAGNFLYKALPPGTADNPILIGSPASLLALPRYINQVSGAERKPT